MDTTKGNGRGGRPILSIDSPIYAFTQTFQQKLEKWKPLRQLREIVFYLETLAKYCTYVLYPELTPDRGRLHLHGTITFNKGTRIQYENYGRKLLDSYGFSKVKTIDDTEKWMTYCQKDWLFNMQLFKLKEPITDLNYMRLFEVIKPIEKITLDDHFRYKCFEIIDNAYVEVIPNLILDFEENNL